MGAFLFGAPSQPPGVTAAAFCVTCYGDKGSEYHRLCSGLHGVSGTVHWAAPHGGICPPDPSLRHLVWSLLDSAPRLQAPQTPEGRPGFPPRLVGDRHSTLLSHCDYR